MSYRASHPFAAALLACGALAAAGPASATAASDFAWKGPSSSSNWSVGSNWSGGAAPAANSAIGTLTFAPEAPLSCDVLWCNASVNDVPGLSVGALSITDPRVKIEGESITLGAGGMSVRYASSHQGVFDTPIALSADQTWTIDRPAGQQDFGHRNFFQVRGPVAGSHALSVKLDAGSTVLLGGTTEVGPVTIEAPPIRLGSGRSRLFPSQVQLRGSLNATNGNPITVTGIELETSASVGAVDLHDASLKLGYPGSAGTVTAASLKMDQASQLTINIPSNGAERGVDYSSLHATGPVHLGGFVSVIAGSAFRCFQPAVGTTFTVLSTTGELTGTFTGDVDADHDAIYPGVKSCGDASDRLLEYRYDRSSMPRTVKMVVVPSGKSTAKPEDLPPTTPTGSTTPTTPTAPTTPTIDSTSTSATTTSTEPSPSGRSAISPPNQVPAPLIPTERSGITLASQTVRLAMVPLQLKKQAACPARATVIIRSGTAKITRRVAVTRSGAACTIDLTVKLKGKLARSSRLKVSISGKGVKSTSKTVKATPAP